MSQALTPPFLVACLLLCVAGASKLRSPHVAAGTLRALSLAGGVWPVRGLAIGELLLGAACAVHPTRGTAAVLTAAYLMFAGVAAALLGRRRAGCGCFGDIDTPVSRVHVVANAALATVTAAAALASPRGLAWLANQPAGTGTVLAVGIAGAVYATVLVYTQLPMAWTVWSGE